MSVRVLCAFPDCVVAVDLCARSTDDWRQKKHYEVICYCMYASCDVRSLIVVVLLSQPMR